MPLMYESVKDFSQGIALVRLNGKAGLINKENKVVVPMTDVKDSGIFITSDIYSFGGKTYDKQGNLIEEERIPDYE